MNKKIAIAAVLSIAAIGSAAAQGRPDARAMTCERVQDLLVQEGAVVLTTGQHTYDRYISWRGSCPAPTVPERTWIGTSDTDSCPVYHCVQRILPFDD